MERLTKRHADKTMRAYMACYVNCIDDDFDCNDCKKLDEIVDRLAAYEDTGLEPKEVRLIANVLQEVGETYNCWFGYVVNCVLENSYLKDLAKAEKDGRLVKYLPGDTVYDRFGMEWTVTSSEIYGHDDGSLLHLYRCGHPGTDDYCALGTDEIFTRAGAEAALERWKEEQDE